MEKKNDLTYTDKETGQKLYGYSLHDLESLNKNIQDYNLQIAGMKKVTILLAVILILFLMYILWLTYYVIHFNVVNNIVGACVR